MRYTKSMIDIRQFFRSTKITFVAKKYEHGDVYTFSFKAQKPLRHIAGQHGVFILPKLKGFHIFSLASAPEEEHVMIGTHVRKESKYKMTLDRLKPGDNMTMLGPVMNFTLGDATDVVFLAQGIGITPFRSMLVHKTMTNAPTNVTLVHVDSHGHVYEDLTKKAATKAYYPVNPQELTQNVADIVTQKDNSALYYISGSPRFVRATKETLRRLGVKKQMIKTDGFLGY